MQLVGNGCHTALGTGFIARLSAMGTRHTDHADDIVADHDGHATAERDHTARSTMATEMSFELKTIITP